MTATATHPGVVTYPGTTIGLRGELEAEPQTENGIVLLDDGITIGPAYAQTDATGTLQGGGLKVPIVSGLLWRLMFRPFDDNLGGKLDLGVYNLNTSGVPIEDLVVANFSAIDATTAADIEAAVALGATNDTATASFVNNEASATVTALNKREAGYNVIGHGLVSSTTTNQGTALLAANTAAIAKGIPLVIPKGVTIGVGTGITLPTDSWIIGAGTVQTTAGTGPVIATAASATNVRVEGITIKNNGFATTAFQPGAGSDTVTLRGVNFVGDGPGSANVGVNIAAGSYANITIDDCDFSGYTNNIRSQQNVGGTMLRITRNRITSWGSRGIYLMTGPTRSWDDVEIDRNRVKGLVAGSQVRYPIRVEQNLTTDLQHTNVKVRGNRVFGPGTGYVGTNTSPWTGTADQISITGVKGGSIESNLSVGGGEAGLTCTNCTDMVVANNRVRDCGISGIAIGANGLTTPGTHDITVTGNSIFGAGYDTTVENADCAVRTYDADNILISGNTYGNLAGATAFTQHGISSTNTSNLTIGINHNHGITGTNFYDGGGNTNIVQPPPPATGDVFMVQTADKILTQSDATNYSDITGTTVTLAPGTYLITGSVEYEGTTTVKPRFRFSVAGLGQSGTWSPRSPATTVTTVSGSLNMGMFGYTSNVQVGSAGIGTPLNLNPTGCIVVTTAGTIKLQAVQGVAEATDVTVRKTAILFKKVA